jgi:cystathionine beta-lyase family protein involved in aluminum resistance
MDNKLYNILSADFGINSSIVELSKKAEKQIGQVFSSIDKVKELNQLKVIKAMQNNNISTFFNRNFKIIAHSH